MVVYFDPCLGAAHSKDFSNLLFQYLLWEKLKKLQKCLKTMQKLGPGKSGEFSHFVGLYGTI